jgi:hypothetical protein
MSIIAINPKKESQINPDNLLGYLEFHSIPDLRIHKADLATLWAKHSLSNEFLPGEIRACDAYRRATAKTTQTVTVNWRGGQYTAKLMVRELKSNAQEIVRLLVREVLDTKNEVLDYAVVGKMTFSRDQETMSIRAEYGYLNEFDYQMVLDQTVSTFNHYVSYHTRDTVRNIINKVIRSTNPVRIMPRSQGKFVPKRCHGTLLSLQALLRDIEAYANNQDCCLDIIPIVDTAEQRQLVTRRVKAELGAEMDELVSELAEQLKTADKSISIETAQRMAQRAQDIQKRALEYEKMLNVRLTVLRSQLMEFINRTKVVADESQHMVS